MQRWWVWLLFAPTCMCNLNSPLIIKQYGCLSCPLDVNQNQLNTAGSQQISSTLSFFLKSESHKTSFFPQRTSKIQEHTTFHKAALTDPYLFLCNIWSFLLVVATWEHISIMQQESGLDTQCSKVGPREHQTSQHAFSLLDTSITHTTPLSNELFYMRTPWEHQKATRSYHRTFGKINQNSFCHTGVTG